MLGSRGDFSGLNDIHEVKNKRLGDPELLWEKATGTWRLVNHPTSLPPIISDDNRYFETESPENEDPFPKENN